MSDPLLAAARAVFTTLEQRSYDARQRYDEDLVRHLLCHELLTLVPELKPRVWVGYRPWPEESDETLDLWIDGARESETVAVEVRAGDPASEYPGEGARVRGHLTVAFLKLATAVRHGRARRGYALLFCPSAYLPTETPAGRLARTAPGAPVRVSTETLQPHTGSMDWADYEELLHPQEATPDVLEITLLDGAKGETGCYWLWAVSVPT